MNSIRTDLERQGVRLRTVSATSNELDSGTGEIAVETVSGPHVAPVFSDPLLIAVERRYRKILSRPRSTLNESERLEWELQLRRLGFCAALRERWPGR